MSGRQFIGQNPKGKLHSPRNGPEVLDGRVGIEMNATAWVAARKAGYGRPRGGPLFSAEDRDTDRAFAFLLVEEFTHLAFAWAIQPPKVGNLAYGKPPRK